MAGPYRLFPKCCKMTVIGNNVTVDQASEIILLTTSLSFQSNDSIWKEQLYTILGIKPFDSDEIYNMEKELGTLPLNYIANHKIATNYINGPYGWCDWNGNIGCDNFPIEKYADNKSIYDDWVEVAKKWPYLSLTAQIKTEDDRPIVNYIIKNGTVREQQFYTEICYGKTKIDIYAMFRLDGERGCTVEQFKHAIKVVKDI